MINRRIKKPHIILLMLGSFIYFTVVHIIFNPYYSEYEDKDYKLKAAEDAINSNNASGECKIPKLPVYAAEIMPFVFDEPSIDCGSDVDWMSCVGSLCTINKSIISKYGTITCNIADILRKNEYSFIYGKQSSVTDRYILTESDFATANCQVKNSFLSWSGILIGIRNELGSQSKQYSMSNNDRLNVLWFGFDSVSRNSFIRKLPNTYEYLTKQLNGDVLEGYNIIGDGTPQALIPLLTGYTELELPETRKRIRNSHSVDIYPMIWKKYHDAGYVTGNGEDAPMFGTFTYRLNGFNAQPTDHYMRTFYLAIENELNRKRFCLGAKPRHQIMLDYTTQFMGHYSNRPRFIFNFHSELSHDSMNLFGVADNDVTNWLKNLDHSGLLNNTIFIFMSDHGNRFAEIRNTFQGKFEERLPFFSFVFPEWFKTTYKIEYLNFKQNLKRLTTPFDVHATLNDILNFRNGTRKTIEKPAQITRAISLFDTIPVNRSCSDAYIEPHWCACMNWQSLENLDNKQVIEAADTIVIKLNQLTASHRNKCSLLRLHNIKWAIRLIPHNNLLRFRKTGDMDGFMPVLSALSPTRFELFQFKLETLPGRGIYEATTYYNVTTKKFTVNEADISRINKYGSQANCILKSNPEIRKYCFCKSTSQY